MNHTLMVRAMLGASLIALGTAGAHAETAPAQVNASVTYDNLVIAPNQIPTAAPGKLLTLSVDGVEMPLMPGHYTGKVTLSVTDDIVVKYHDLPEHHFRAAAYVENGVLVPAKSAQAALLSARVEPGLLSGASITSRGDRFNGIVVNGGTYRIDRPIIDMTGNGGNDFAGFGAAITAKGDANLTIDRPIIRTRGAIRTAIFVGGHANVVVNDAEIEVLNGTLPADYKFTVDVGKMMEVPWMLGLSGNVRATNLVDYGQVTYNRSHIRAQGWGAMSTDDNVRVRMQVNDSLIETVDSGYGCYSIGDSVDIFSRSILRAADVGCIMAAEGSVSFTDGTHVESGRYGVMMHSGAGGGRLVIDKGSSMISRETAIAVKGLGTTILVDGALVSAGNGVILQSMENDDPFMKAMMSGHVPEGMSAPPPGMAPDGDHADKKGPPPSPDVVATFRNTAVSGDFFNARPKDSAMVLRFEAAMVKGRISTSTVAPAGGKEPVRATYQEIGRVTNSPGVVAGGKGLSVSLDAVSRWVVTGTSYMTQLTLAAGAKLEAATGKLTLTVNGKPVTVRPGSYKGSIVIQAN